jgi:hypothetical protein
MTAYTEEADEAITSSPRPVEPGDLVTHEDDIGGSLGRVFSVEEGMVRVSWSHSGKCVPVKADRLHLLERPDAYACVSFNGTDEISGDTVEYCFVTVGSPSEVAGDVKLYERNPSYTVDSFRISETPATEVSEDNEDPE